MGKNVGEELKKALSSSALLEEEEKEELWQAVKTGISVAEKGGGRMNAKKKRPWVWLKYAAAALIFLVVGTLTTKEGQAAIRNLYDLLVPQKTIVEELEGEKEETEVTLKEMKAGYTIYFDENRYFIEEKEGYDIIAPLPVEGMTLSDKYFMEIRQVEDKSPAELAAAKGLELSQRYEQTVGPEEVEDPVKGWAVRGKSYTGAMVLERYYYVDNTKGGSFEIRQMLTIEAESGHGARFNNMLGEFRIVEIPAD